MKKCLSILIVVFLGGIRLLAQDLFFPSKEGMVLCYNYRDTKGMLLEHVYQTVMQVSQSDDELKVTYRGERFSPQMELLNTEELTSGQSNSGFTLGLNKGLFSSLSNFSVTQTGSNYVMKANKRISVRAGTFTCYEHVYKSNEFFHQMGIAPFHYVVWLAKNVGVVKIEGYNARGRRESYMELVEIKQLSATDLAAIPSIQATEQVAQPKTVSVPSAQPAAPTPTVINLQAQPAESPAVTIPVIPPTQQDATPTVTNQQTTQAVTPSVPTVINLQTQWEATPNSPTGINLQTQPETAPTTIVALPARAAETGDTPYAYCYGTNSKCTGRDCSQIKVITPASSDVLVTLKQNDRVVSHAFIRANSSYIFYVPNGTYQPFFYYGSNWDPEKAMKQTECGLLQGGFANNEHFGKDSPQTLNNNLLTYELILQQNGNFSTKPSNPNEAF